MAQSLSIIYLHIVFHVKTISPIIEVEHLDRVYAYIGELINSTGCQTIKVGGMPDHIHVLCLLSKTENIAHLVEEMKRNSSRWIKTMGSHYGQFAWQGGYAAFSVSQSVVEKTIHYVENQKEHHRKMTFREEYLQLLKCII